MNFQTPLSALSPGTSGRLLTALVDHHTDEAAGPLTLDELSKDASVAPAQLEAALFRLGLLGLIAPRRKGEAVRLVAGHLAWAALRQLTDLRGRVVDTVREQVAAHVHPAPDHLVLNGAVIEGTATRPADVLEVIVVPPATAPADWQQCVAALVAQLSLVLERRRPPQCPRRRGSGGHGREERRARSPAVLISCAQPS